MNEKETEIMTKAWSDWFKEDDEIPEVGFVFRKAWEFQHLRYNLLIDSYEGIIKTMQAKIDRLEEPAVVKVLHGVFCSCDLCTKESPELF